MMLAFEILPDVARRHWIRAFEREDPDRPPLALDSEERDGMESWYGVRIPEEVLGRLAADVLESDAPLRSITEFFTYVHPDAFAGPALERIATRLRDDEDFGEEFFPEALRRTMGYLEVRAPGRLEEILTAWRPKLTEEQTEGLLGGDLGHWPPHGPESLPARALAAGQPIAIAELLRGADGNDVPEAVRESVHTFAGRGDFIGAAIEILGSRPDPTEAFLLGRANDPRVAPFLRRLRDERRARWSAVAGLAFLGDEEARAEWIGLVREGRLWLVYEWPEELACLGGDPALVELWIERIETTCCVSCHAQSALQEVFPTLDIDDVPPAYPVIRRRVAAWYARHRGTFRRSRILNGLVPTR